MSNFLSTPTNFRILDRVLTNPETGRWEVPTVTYTVPYQVTPQIDTQTYIQNICQYYHTVLTEKWLYQDPCFNPLLKYFKVQPSNVPGQQVTDFSVGLNPRVPRTTPAINQSHSNAIFSYVESYFVTVPFVEETLKNVVDQNNLSWNDLIANNSLVKDAFAEMIAAMLLYATTQI